MVRVIARNGLQARLLRGRDIERSQRAGQRGEESTNQSSLFKMTLVSLWRKDSGIDVDIFVTLLQPGANVVFDFTFVALRPGSARGETPKSKWRKDSRQRVEDRLRVVLSLEASAPNKFSLDSFVREPTASQLRVIGEGCHGRDRCEEKREMHLGDGWWLLKIAGDVRSDGGRVQKLGSSLCFILTPF
jgi:hypothetical protein